MSLFQINVLKANSETDKRGEDEFVPSGEGKLTYYIRFLFTVAISVILSHQQGCSDFFFKNISCVIRLCLYV